MSRTSRSVALVAFMALAAAACGDANPTGPGTMAADNALMSHVSAPTVNPWTAFGPGTVTVVSDGTTGDAVMTYSASDIGYDTQTWSFGTTAARTGTVTLPWSYSGFHAFYQVTVHLEAYVTSGGVTTVTPILATGPADCCTSPSAGFSYNGSISLNVQAGDSYGFTFGGSNFDSNNSYTGTFTVDLPENPATKDDCKKGGWEDYGFRNQGQCIAYVNTGHDSR